MHVRSALVLVALAGCGLGGKGERKTCEKACRNYATLAFWAKWDPVIDQNPEAQRPALRKQKLVELSDILARGVNLCVEHCVESNNEDQYECMAEAKDWKTANACAPTQEQAKDE